MEMMKKAWNQEDSPFKGTDFDPSKMSLERKLDLLKNELNMTPNSGDSD